MGPSGGGVAGLFPSLGARGAGRRSSLCSELGSFLVRHSYLGQYVTQHAPLRAPDDHNEDFTEDFTEG